MALSRVKTWNPGDVLTAADLNGEFNNVLNNPITLVSPTTGVINFNLQNHTNLVPTAITASSGVAGQVLTVSTAANGAPGWAYAGVGSRTRNLSGTASSQSAQFAADQILFQTSDGLRSFICNATSAFVVNLTSSVGGQTSPLAGARDQAAIISSSGQWVHYYAITTGQNSTQPQGIVSLTAPPSGPTLPSSYLGWAYLGAQFYSTTQTLPSMTVRGATWANYALTNFLSGGTSTSEVTINLNTTGVVPPNATSFALDAGVLFASTAGAVTANLLFKVVSAATFRQALLRSDQTGSQAMQIINTYDTVPNTGTFIYQWATTFLAQSVSAGIPLYRMPNGDNA